LPVWDDTIGTFRPTYKWTFRTDHFYMGGDVGTDATDGSGTDTEAVEGEVADVDATHAAEAAPTPDTERGALWLVGVSSRVVVAAADAGRRASVLDVLTQTMPEGTTFVEASTVVQVLAYAGASRMVLIGGALEDAPAASLKRMLARRYPQLHVVVLEPSQNP
jgi:hypothetical protein